MHVVEDGLQRRVFLQPVSPLQIPVAKFGNDQFVCDGSELLLDNQNKVNHYLFALSLSISACLQNRIQQTENVPFSKRCRFAAKLLCGQRAAFALAECCSWRSPILKQLWRADRFCKMKTVERWRLRARCGMKSASHLRADRAC